MGSAMDSTRFFDVDRRSSAEIASPRMPEGHGEQKAATSPSHWDTLRGALGMGGERTIDPKLGHVAEKIAERRQQFPSSSKQAAGEPERRSWLHSLFVGGAEQEEPEISAPGGVYTARHSQTDVATDDGQSPQPSGC